jgi:hypothetical protein
MISENPSTGEWEMKKRKNEYGRCSH